MYKDFSVLWTMWAFTDCGQQLGSDHSGILSFGIISETLWTLLVFQGYLIPKLEAGTCVEAENVARQRCARRARSAREKIENVTPLWLRSEKKQIDGEIMSLYGGNSAHDRRRFLP